MTDVASVSTETMDNNSMLLFTWWNRTKEVALMLRPVTCQDESSGVA